MGSLLGHIVPGLAFLAVSLWWTFEFLIKYHESRLLRRPAYFHYSHPGRIRQQQRSQQKHHQQYLCFPPWESMVKLVMISIGITGEFVTALDDQWHFKSLHNGQHMTMFAFFLLPVLAEMAYFYGLPGLPPKLDIVLAILAFLIEGLLFVWHLHGRTHLDVQARIQL